MSRFFKAIKHDGTGIKLLEDCFTFDDTFCSVTELSKPTFVNACIIERSSHAVSSTGTPA